MPAQPVEEGFICAFHLNPPRPLGGAALSEANPEGPRWLHLNLVDARIRRWIDARRDIPEQARALLLDPESRVRSECGEQGFAIALGDLHHDFEDDPEGFGMLRLYVDRAQIVTARRRPIKSVELAHPRVEAQPEPRDTTDIFVMLLRCHGEAVAGVIRRFAERVDDAEDEILAGNVQKGGSGLGRIRRLLARLRRHVHANRAELRHLMSTQPEFWSEEQTDEVRGSVESLESLGQDIELVSERARLLQEEIAGRLNEATSKNLYVLSILTTALLPITLITGIFGMNLGGMPFANHPHGFAIVMFVILTGVIAAISFLRRRNVV
jgi:zinc transporter